LFGIFKGCQISWFILNLTFSPDKKYAKLTVLEKVILTKKGDEILRPQKNKNISYG
jgi:hypothetical protein